MRVWLLILALFPLLPGLAMAGAWPREPGRVFLSYSHTLREEPAALGTPAFDPAGSNALYLEYGLTARTTLGLDLWFGDDGTGTAIAFMRWPLGTADRPLRTAWQLGIGEMRAADRSETLLQVGAGLGRGIETRFGPGWLALDAQLQRRMQSGETVLKADATVGLRAADRTTLILQLQTGDYPGSSPYARLAPSVVREFGAGRHLEAGVELGLAGDSTAGLKIGTWLEF